VLARNWVGSREAAGNRPAQWTVALVAVGSRLVRVTVLLAAVIASATGAFLPAEAPAALAGWVAAPAASVDRALSPAAHGAPPA
jgi:hypothetical protein